MLMSRRHAVTVLVGALLTAPSHAQQALDPDAAYDALLRRYVRSSPDGTSQVDYVRWHATAEDRRALDDYLSQQSARRPSAMPHAEAFAYWVNLYNAVHIKIILANFPVSSFAETPSRIGPWKDKRLTIEGRTLSLDEMKNEIMRPTFKDPRLHYAVNCASIGCPRLMDRAWRAQTLDTDLDAAARTFINHPRAVTVLPSRDFRVSSIYIWFAADFGGDATAVVAHLKRYAEPTLAAQLSSTSKLVDGGYDWAINALAPPRPGG